MNKTAFAYWENRIAPVFDIARDIHIIEFESGKIIGESLGSIPETMPSARALRLAELGINTLVCGAISGDMHKLIEAYGIQVISFVAGDTHDVIHAWITGDIHDGLFCMPGCGQGRRYRHGGMHGPGGDGPVMNKNEPLTGRYPRGRRIRVNKT
jgi:predicted Fe-Mo cluster-binding NifX family protein